MTLFLAILLLSGAAYLGLEVASTPSRARRARLQRAANYGKARIERVRGEPTTGLVTRMTPLVENLLVRLVLRLNPRTSVENVAGRLLAAGYARRCSPRAFLALKGGTCIGGLALGLTLGATAGSALAAFALVLSLGAVGLIAPEMVLTRRIRARREQINAALPNALDLLAVCVEAGLGFDAALTRLVERSEGPLADEFELVLNEIRVGESRVNSLKKLAERIDTHEVMTFAAAIIQADQLGIPLSEILRVQAAETRHRRQAVAEEWAMKLSVKMLFPVVAFIFPALFVVVLGPALLGLGALL